MRIQGRILRASNLGRAPCAQALGVDFLPGSPAGQSVRRRQAHPQAGCSGAADMPALKALLEKTRRQRRCSPIPRASHAPMASSARRDPLRELSHLLRASEPGSNNLGEFVAANAGGLAQELGVSAGRLEAERVIDDEELAPRIRQLLERAKDRHVQQDLERRRERSLAAARRLGATVR